MKNFGSYHPIILFFYFIGVIFITMFTMNPTLILISFVCSIFFSGMLTGAKKTAISLAYSLPMLAIIALTNPLFVHEGETTLFVMFGNDITLEAMIYGLVAGMMIISVFYWFRCYSEIMTSDKFIYLFGRVAPKFSLLLSMTLAFVPKFKRQYRAINDSQKALGIYSSKSYFDKVRSKMRVLSILISWSLENSIDTGDSMKSRGYGLKGRTSYSLFRWRSTDTIVAIIVLALTISVVTMMFMHVGSYTFYPALKGFDWSILSCLLYLALFLLMTLSAILEIKENVKWRYLKSKI